MRKPPSVASDMVVPLAIVFIVMMMVMPLRGF
jgi:hypothetical protein